MWFSSGAAHIVVWVCICVSSSSTLDQTSWKGKKHRNPQHLSCSLLAQAILAQDCSRCVQTRAYIGPRFGHIVTSSEMFVVKRGGHQQEVKFDKITNRIKVLCDGLDATYVDLVLATQKVLKDSYNGIATSEIDTLAAETCAYMSH